MVRDPLSNPLPPRGVPCTKCGQDHITRHGKAACLGHVRFNRDPESPDYRKRLDKPRPCTQSPRIGLQLCRMHGPKRKDGEIGRRRVTEQRIEAAARKLIPDAADRAPITNPLETLLDLASEANAFRESLRVMANELDGRIRYAAGAGSGEQLRAEVATYQHALKQTTDLLVAIARLDIETMLARIEARKVDAVVAALTAGADEAGLTAEQKRKVLQHAGRHLRSIAS